MSQTTPLPDPEAKTRIATPKTPDPEGGGKPVLVCVAWPYANGHLHLGHIAGSLLPPDIYARFQRMSGNRVLMVSGSDCHGTPILLTAEKEGKTPQEIVDRYNEAHIQALKDFGIAFDIFTKTTTDNHRKNVQDIFLTLRDEGYLETRTTEAPFDPKNQRFLPDRYVEGTCPHCGYEEARGDQCDDCGKTLDPHELIDPYPKGHKGGSIEFRETEHFYFLLSRFQDRLQGFVKDHTDHWRQNTVNFTQNWLDEGLKDRPITRDLTWGVPIPLDGYDDKRLYVWFEAVCGYFTSTIEWSARVGRPDAWRSWWEDPSTVSTYFLGKDNIPFHTIIWPAILMGYSDGRAKKDGAPLVLPYDVPANEFLNLAGQQFSKSRGIGIWVPDIVKRFDPDTVRYYLSVNMPEQRDANWTWEDFVAKVNDELVDTFGNLAHRALTFTNKHFGAVPPAVDPSPADAEMVSRIEEVHKEVTVDLDACRFKKALRAIMALAAEGNRYFDSQKPWQLVKEDQDRAGTVLNTSLRLVRALDLMLAPFIPFASERLWGYLGQSGSVHETRWDTAREPIQEGTKLERPQVLFTKLDLKDIIEEEAPKQPKPSKKQKKESKTMAETATETQDQITIDDFARMDLRIARITKVEDHPDADKLYVIHLDVGELGERQVCAGLKKAYAPTDMEGRLVTFIANLKPAKLRGVESQGMILAGEDKDTIAFLTPEKDVAVGAKVR